MIYTTGDSHAQWTFHDVPNCKVHSVSSITMQRVGRLDDDLILGAVEAMPLGPGDWLILACGEIDVRAHIYRKLMAKENLHELLQRWVAGYMARALTLPLRGARVAILSVTPPVPEGEILYAGVILPVAGSNEDRVYWTRLLNHYLEEACAQHGFPFINVYDQYCDRHGLLRADCSDGSVHIAKTDAVRAELQRLGIR